jgi:hypothetical protein
MSKREQLPLTVIFHETRSELANELEGRIRELRNPKPSRRWETGSRSSLAQIVLSPCDVTYVVLRESWKLGHNHVNNQKPGPGMGR